jgi:hypothetical protein
MPANYFWTMVAAIAGSTGAFLSGIAILASLSMHRRQSKLTQAIHEQQTLLAQRQLLLPLWEYLSTLDNIESSEPIWPDVVKAVNTLELVALCCEGQLIDQSLIRRTFRERFVEMFAKIEECRTPPRGFKSGRDMLAENKAASKMYRELRLEMENEGSIRPLSGN